MFQSFIHQVGRRPRSASRRIGLRPVLAVLLATLLSLTLASSALAVRGFSELHPGYAMTDTPYRIVVDKDVRVTKETDDIVASLPGVVRQINEHTNGKLSLAKNPIRPVLASYKPRNNDIVIQAALRNIDATTLGVARLQLDHPSATIVGTRILVYPRTFASGMVAEVLLHEICHALGLGHCEDCVDDRPQTMNPTLYNSVQACLGEGDVRGLRYLTCVGSGNNGRGPAGKAATGARTGSPEPATANGADPGAPRPHPVTPSAALPTSDQPVAAAPTIEALSPNWSSLAGGGELTIQGTGFTAMTAVYFGTTAARFFRIQDDQTLLVHIPEASVDGQVHVHVATPDASSLTTEKSKFYYFGETKTPQITNIRPAIGTNSGGQRVSITGDAISPLTQVYFGDRLATDVKILSPTLISATTPPGTAGEASVSLVSPWGRSEASSSNIFTYLPGPEITALTPNVGPSLGGNQVTIRGDRFMGLGATTVHFGPAQASRVRVVSDNEITAMAPPLPLGNYSVTVRNSNGESVANEQSQYASVPPPPSLSVVDTQGPSAGGQPIGIKLTGARQTKAVYIGDLRAWFSVEDDGTLKVSPPPHKPGKYDIKVVSDASPLPSIAQRAYTYLPAG